MLGAYAKKPTFAANLHCKRRNIKTILFMKFRTLLVAALAAVTLGASAQGENTKHDFKPYWSTQIQGGAGYSLGGSTKLSEMFTPAAGLSVGYRFSPVVGARLHASGWQGKNGWDYTHSPQTYTWTYGTLGLDAMIDFNTLFAGYNPNRCFTVYGILGAGYIRGFENDAAQPIHKADPNELRLTWQDGANFFSARGGVQLDFRLTKNLSLNLEGLTYMTSDEFNSKDGDNPDWQFNAFVGLTYRCGDFSAPAPVVPVPPVTTPTPAPAPKAAPAPALAPKPAPAPITKVTRNVFFQINSAKISAVEMVKVNEVVSFLNANPNAKVAITGYADKGTGNATINRRLSQQRANAVYAELVKQKIAANRIIKDAKGDTEQPFEVNEQNRCVIAIAE